MTDLKSLLRDAEPAPADVDVDAVIGRGDQLRRHRRQRSAVASAAAAVVLVAGVLGVVARSDGPDERPVELLAGAGDAAREAGSARMRVVMEATSEDTTSRTEIEGVVDFAGGRGRLTATTDGEQVTVLSERGTVYISVPESDRAATGGKPWMSHPVADPGESILDLGDPTQVLDALGAMTGVEVVGSDEVNGVDATHYTVDPMAGAIDDDSGIDAQVDVWVTDDGLPTRVSLDYDFGRMALHAIVDLTDFGVEVEELDLPDAEDVFAGTEELAQQWLQPRLGDADALASVAEGLTCSYLPQLAALMEQQAETMTETQIAALEQALAQIDAQVASIDDTTADGAKQKADLLAATASMRALVDAARTGAPIDPAALQQTFRQICP